MKSLAQILDELNPRLAASELAPVFVGAVNALHRELAALCGVQEDEVAILLLDARDNIRFLSPTYLERAGLIPASYTRAFVTKAMQAMQPAFDNRFAFTTHFRLFEDFKKNNPKALPIQKMLCAPLVRGGTKTYGAVEISRKGASPEEAGADWADQDMRKVVEYLAPLVDRFYLLCKHSDQF